MMYNDAEYQNCIHELSASCETCLQDGYPFIVKPVPGLGHKGDIDPRVNVMLHQLSADPGPETIDLTDLAPLRACMNWKSFDITNALISVAHTSFIGRDGNRVPLRVYSFAEVEGPKPCIVYFHGGGWIGGKMAYVENICKLIAEKIRGVVVSVDYRLAPEDPFPSGFYDCFDAVKHVYENSGKFAVNKRQIGVSGDSAGSNLAAVCALCDRDAGTGMIRHQALAYPCVNPCNAPSDYYTWHEDFYNIQHHREDILNLCVYELPIQRCIKIVEPAYVQGRYDIKYPYVAPLFADDLKNVAPAIFILPEYDYLRQEGEAYAKRLAADGVEVKVICYSGINHGFMEKVGQYPQAEDAIDEIAKSFLAAVAE